ncbi:hypothetical protein EC55P2_00053 [Enterococcus phage EC55P2]|nr:hypothetical protein EC55P2_00053 [Enterococcus phage EC55P2]
MNSKELVNSIEYTIKETRLYLLGRLPDNSESTWQRMKWSATNPIHVLLASIYTSQLIDTEQYSYLEKLIDETDRMSYNKPYGGIKL